MNVYPINLHKQDHQDERPEPRPSHDVAMALYALKAAIACLEGMRKKDAHNYFLIKDRVWLADEAKNLRDLRDGVERDYINGE